MDEMKVKLSTKFMRKLVSKLISNAICKKFGFKVDIQINALEVNFIDGDTKLSTNVDAKLSSEEFEKLVKTIGLN